MFYRHPKKTSGNTFLEQLKCSLSKIKSKSKHTFLCGDFSYGILKLLNTSNFLQPCPIEPTRIVSGNRPSLVDNIFINITNKNIYSGNLLDKLTDHLPDFVVIKNLNKKTSKQKIKMFILDKYLADRKDLVSFLLQQFGKINYKYNIYQDKVVEIIDKNTKLKLKPWIIPGVLSSIKIKNKICVRSRSKFWFGRYEYYKTA